MGSRAEAAPWGRGCKTVFEVLRGNVFEALKVIASEVKKENAFEVWREVVSEVRRDIVFEVRKEFVSEERKETFFEATMEVALMATKHSCFHVLSLVVQLMVGSVYMMAQMSVQDQSQMQPWLHSGCMAPQPRQLWTEECGKMLEDSSPRSCALPSQTRERMVARMEALRGTWLHACDDECWLEEEDVSLWESCMRCGSLPENMCLAMVDVPWT